LFSLRVLKLSFTFKLLQWAPSGDVYFTATTAPRLRQGNGFKIWHYSGSLLFELLWPEKKELLELMWQKYPEGVFKENAISYEKVSGIQSVQKEASAKKYVPPNVRLFGEDNSSSVAPPPQGPIPGLPPGYTSSKSQPSKGKSNSANNVNRKKPQADAAQPGNPSDNKDDENRKKASAVKKKLKDIRILKEKQEKGEKLDKNQMNKIATESDLYKELAALQLS
jgi:translation initiation factor 2A